MATPNDRQATGFFVSSAGGTARLLRRELEGMGLSIAREQAAGVEVAGGLNEAYRACLWSRVGSRVLWPIARFGAADADSLYEGVRGVPWEEHVDPDGTIAVDAVTVASAVDHAHFAALKVKDAIVDRLRDRFGRRPSVDVQAPDVQVNVYLLKDAATVSVDLSGQSLHRRGYREEGLEAPLKENLAAALLLQARWPEMAADGRPLLDPMCGSGTFLTEAAMVAGDVAPGLTRKTWGFQGWQGHEPATWEHLLGEARDRATAGRRKVPRIVGFDRDAKAVTLALRHVESLGMTGAVHVERRALADATPLGKDGPGLVIVNPPYGQRLGRDSGLPGLYGLLGERLRAAFGSWTAAVFTGNPQLAAHLKLRPRRTHEFDNGGIASRLLIYRIEDAASREDRTGDTGTEGRAAPDEGQRPDLSVGGPASGAEMLANRLRRNLRHIGKWARRQGVPCYRVYDGDLPEYPFVVDLFESRGVWGHVQFYDRSDRVEEAAWKTRQEEALSAAREVLGIEPGRMLVKVRQRQRGADQYERLDDRGEFLEVGEGPCRFLVNLKDYLDTGLFLDNRMVRARIHDLADGKRFLNLFAYTATATVHAALGGARLTMSVDLSNTYLEWARRNFDLNGIRGDRHTLLRADCIAWVEEACREGKLRFDLIYLDAPTFSNSKAMGGSFDVQRDHAALVEHALKLLDVGGALIFSSNRKGFRFDREAFPDWDVKDISGSTLPKDFERRREMHHAFVMTRP